MESKMKKRYKNKSGLQILFENAKRIFRIENQDVYSREDYRMAERKFLKYALEQRIFEIEDY